MAVARPVDESVFQEDRNEQASAPESVTEKRIDATLSSRLANRSDVLIGRETVGNSTPVAEYKARFRSVVIDRAAIFMEMQTKRQFLKTTSGGERVLSTSADAVNIGRQQLVLSTSADSN